jgi:hypothetical protein
VRKEWLFKLAAALGCAVADLHGGEGGVSRSKRWARALVNLSDARKPRQKR